MNDPAAKEPSYFEVLHDRFSKELPNGARAELRRCVLVEDTRYTPALYRLLLSDRQITEAQTRLAYMLPFCPIKDGKAHPGAVLVAAGVSEERVMQIARTHRTNPSDALTGLRRVVQHAEGKMPWVKLARLVSRWRTEDVRELVEGYFLNLHKLDKGAQS